MPTAPSVLLSWATGVGAELTEPSAPLQASGWITGDKPGAGHMNFVVKNMIDWMIFYNAGGLGAIIEFPDLATMKAYGPSIIEGQTAHLTNYGLYKYYGASVASGDDIYVIDPDTAGDGRWLMLARYTIYVSGSTTEGRLTLATSTPVLITEQTAKTTVYFSPYKGNLISLFDGTSLWSLFPFTEISIKLTDAQSGATHSGTKVIDGLTDTSQLIVGMEITGTNVGAASTIASIDSATQVTGTVNSTGSATNTITFKVPASIPLDIFAFNNAGTVKLEMVKWTSDTARATALVLQNGVWVKTGATTRKYLGTVRTTTTAGQTEFSFGGSASASGTIAKLYVWNYYNRIRYEAVVRDSTNSWNYNASAYRAANNSATMRVNFINGVAEETYFAKYFGLYSYGVDSTFGVGVGLNSTTANSAVVFSTMPVSFTSEIIPISAEWFDFPAVGFNYVSALERSTASFTVSGYGDNNGTTMQSGFLFRGAF